MQGFDECGKIDAIRFFMVTALLSSLASAICLLAAFAPFLKPTDAMRRKAVIGGVSLASVVLLWSFLGACIAGSVNMEDGYSLSGAGFVFLVLQIFIVILAILLVVWELRWKSASSNTVGTSCQEKKIAQPQDARDSAPTLLAIGGKPQDKDLKKDDAAKNVDAADVLPKVKVAERTAEVEVVPEAPENNSSDEGLQHCLEGSANMQPAIASADGQKLPQEESEKTPREESGKPTLHPLFGGVAALETAHVEVREASVEPPMLQTPRPDQRKQRYVCACPGM